MARFPIVRIVLAAGLLLAPAAGCKGKDTAGGPPPSEAVPVLVAPVARKAVPERLSAVGTVEPSSSVGVRAQVGGLLQQVLFREGQDVRAGDLLFRIDPRPFQAALRQAQANLARDMAQLDNARKELARAADLAGKGMIALSEHDSAKAAAAALEAATEADQAAIESARLQLSYTSIAAPIGGRAGALSVDPGNLVKAAGDPPLVTIDRIDPAFVSFAVPEQHLTRLLAAAAKGPVKVTASVEGGEAREGSLALIGGQVDRSSGTIPLRATFPNPASGGAGGRGTLWPGRFVQVELTLSVLADALVIPSVAVQMGQKGTYVYVVRGDQTAEFRPVKVGRMLDLETLVESGLAAGERVAVDGMLRLSDGAKVAIRGEGPPADRRPGDPRP